MVSQASPKESVSNASTGSGRSDCRMMASPAQYRKGNTEWEELTWVNLFSKKS